MQPQEGRSRAPRAVPYRGSCIILPPDADIDIVIFWLHPTETK